MTRRSHSWTLTKLELIEDCRLQGEEPMRCGLFADQNKTGETAYSIFETETGRRMHMYILYGVR